VAWRPSGTSAIRWSRRPGCRTVFLDVGQDRGGLSPVRLVRLQPDQHVWLMPSFAFGPQAVAQCLQLSGAFVLAIVDSLSSADDHVDRQRHSRFMISR
jgi:hypothetical protein